jgi:hypothetical protein
MLIAIATAVEKAQEKVTWVSIPMTPLTTEVSVK